MRKWTHKWTRTRSRVMGLDFVRPFVEIHPAAGWISFEIHPAAAYLLRCGSVNLRCESKSTLPALVTSGLVVVFYWLLVKNYWLLVKNYWLLVKIYWLLVKIY